MPDQMWNFLVPGTGPHSFRWTGSNAFLDNRVVTLTASQKSLPNYSYDLDGVDLVLERKRRVGTFEMSKWRLVVDGRVVEEHVISEAGVRDMKGKQVSEREGECSTFLSTSASA